MSHITRIDTEITDRTELKATLKELGYVEILENATIYYFEHGITKHERFDFVVRGLPPKPSPVSHPGKKVSSPCTTSPGHELLCFKRRGPAQAFQVLADWSRVGMTKQQYVGIVSRHFAYRAIRRRMEAQGFRLIQEEAKDGRIRLTLARDEKRIEGRISEDGEVIVATRGLLGEACLSATSELEKALSGTVKERTFTPEFAALPEPGIAHEIAPEPKRSEGLRALGG